MTDIKYGTNRKSDGNNQRQRWNNLEMIYATKIVREGNYFTMIVEATHVIWNAVREKYIQGFSRQYATTYAMFLLKIFPSICKIWYLHIILQCRSIVSAAAEFVESSVLRARPRSFYSLFNTDHSQTPDRTGEKIMNLETGQIEKKFTKLKTSKNS